MVGHLTLDQAIGVRVPVPQPTKRPACKSAALRYGQRSIGHLCAQEVLTPRTCPPGIPYLLGKTWTTDAFYRETPARIARRRAEG